MPLDLLVAVDRPFPGLRPFEPHQSLLFFGREQHTEELLRRLAANRFLAVVGTSGSGKSSLVRAGLLPALYRGHLVGSTTHWRIAVMKPGDAPIENLATALAEKDALGPGDRLETLRSSSLGLVQAVRDAKLAPGESLLIVADQFEELFRYSNKDDDASLFVSLLLQAADRFDAPIYVVLTMRSDFLGDCSQFTGLPEALSRSQYLIPRLTREQRQQAIERPLQLAGVKYAPSFVQQLLNDSADDSSAIGHGTGQGTAHGTLARSGRPDPLPVLQHALMKTFEDWKRKGRTGPLELEYYQTIGGIENALHLHAESIYLHKLDAAQQAWAQKIFCCLTTTESGRQIRRPTKLADLYAIIGAATEAQQREVDATLKPFLNPDDSLLLASKQNVIDIPHESLIWKWDRLQKWVVAEADNAMWYVDLANDVCGWSNGTTGLWRDPDLSRALMFARTHGWNAAWATQYTPPGTHSFADAQDFLNRSQTKQTRDRWIWRAAIAAVIIALGAAGYFFQQQQRANAQTAAAQQHARDLEAKQKESEGNAQSLAQEVSATQALLKTSTSPADRERLEKKLQEQQKEADRARLEVEQAKAQATQATRIAASRGVDLATLNDSLQATVNQLTVKNKDLDKNLTDERSKIKALEAEITGLKEDRKPQPSKSQPDPAQAGLTGEQVKRALGPFITTTPPTTACSGRINPVDGLCYVRIPAGNFRMGCSPGDKECAGDEKPVDVQITKPFGLGETEVTQAAYGNVMKGADPSAFKGPQRPLERVSWGEAQNYCAAIGGRLPTEAEWEYAARAGNPAARYGDLDQIAWYGANSKASTHDVRGKRPNAWGLYDMFGNFWEWTSDWFATKLPGGPDPSGPASGGWRVLRGGSWDDNPRNVRVSDRGRLAPVYRYSSVEFRCAWDSL